MEGKNLTTARLAMEADANIIGSAFVVKPEKTLINRLGVIFGIVEIYNLNDIFIDRVLDAIGDLKTEYYLPPFDDKKPERRFEEALARANRRISTAVSESIYPIDLRNLRIVMGLSLGNKIFLSHTGRSQALFFRQKKNGSLLILNILDTGEERPKPEPEKVFSNIISGEITERDTLMVCNNEFLSLMSQNDLGEMLALAPAEEGIKKLEATLHSQPLKSNYYSVLLKSADFQLIAPTAATAMTATTEAATAETAETVAPTKTPYQFDRMRVDNPRPAGPGQTSPGESKTQSSLDRLLITQVRTEQYLTPSLMPAWQKFFFLLFKYFKISLVWLGRGLNITLVWLGRKLHTGYNLLANKIIAGRAAKAKRIINTIEPKRPTQGEILNKDLTTDEFMSAPEPMQSEVAQDAIEQPRPRSSLNWQERFSSGWLAQKINAWINGMIENFLNLSIWQKGSLVAALLLLLIFSQSVVWIGRSSELNSPQTSPVGKIGNQIQSLVDNAEAQNIFNDEKGAYASLAQADELLKTIPVKRSNQSTINNLKQKIDDVRRVLGKEINLADLKPTIDLKLSNPSADIIGLAKTGKYFWVFNNSDAKFYRLDSGAWQWTTATSTVTNAKKLSAVDDKSLIVITGDNSSYKLTLASMAAIKFKPSKDYFNIKTDLKSLTLEPPIASSTISQSVKDGVYQYLLDTTVGRLVVLDDKNVLKRQYTGPFIADGASFVGSAKDKKFWVLFDGKIYQINWDF
ncbi:MAG: hypothetical protein WC473_00755 [Patescibacteria group bacterium]